jgi:hypothetical protein
MQINYLQIFGGNNMKKKIAAIALILFATFASASFASQTPNVVTANKYEYNANGFHAKIITPKITGLADKKAEQLLNKKFKKDSFALMTQFKHEITQMKKEKQCGHIGYDSGYTVLTNNKNNYSFYTYTVNTVGSSSTQRDFYNIDKRTHKLLVLKNIFRTKANYVEKLSKYIKSEMARRNEKEKGMYWIKDSDTTPFQKISKNQDFYINKDGKLVICFEKYEVAPGAAGTPEFVIPDSIIKNIKK